MMRTSVKAFVLLSGGIDSSTCLRIAADEFGVGAVEGISINYGQRHIRETVCAQEQCSLLGVPHHLLDLRGLVPQTMLTDKDAEVPNISYGEIKGVSPTYVPFRNGLMLSAITSYVAGRQAQAQLPPAPQDLPEWAIYFGAHAEDAANWAYPDCTPEFIGAMANAIHIGTYYGVRLHTPLEWCDKKTIIQWGDRLGVDWEKTWSCYKGEALHCGVCPTCRARRDGFVAAGVTDPTKYAA